MEEIKTDNRENVGRSTEESRKRERERERKGKVKK
jgi:hypothetical protein